MMSFLLAAFTVFAIGRVALAYTTRPSRWTARLTSRDPDDGQSVSERIVTQTDLAWIGAQRGAMIAAIRAGDVDSYARSFATDALVFTIAGAVLAGNEALADATSRTLREARVLDVNAATLDRRPLGETVFEEGAFHIQLRRGEADVLSKGRFVAIWKRERREWRIVFEAVRAYRDDDSVA
jgi:ketosteroid isomerase-like protein